MAEPSSTDATGRILSGEMMMKRNEMLELIDEWACIFRRNPQPLNRRDERNDTCILIAERLEQLAAEIRATEATTVQEFRDRHQAMMSTSDGCNNICRNA